MSLRGLASTLHAGQLLERRWGPPDDEAPTALPGFADIQAAGPQQPVSFGIGLSAGLTAAEKRDMAIGLAREGHDGKACAALLAEDPCPYSRSFVTLMCLPPTNSRKHLT